jgi:hypothetical protein
MRTLNKTILSAILIILPFVLSGQHVGPTLAFEKKVHDFGDIQEEGGVAEYDFQFTNTGNQALVISQVTASCGCTTPSWTKAPIKPGEKGYVKVAYNPKNRPNKFNKSITVYSNGDPRVVSLRITGNVIPKPRTIEDDYRFPIGPVRYKSNHFAFVKVFKGEVKTMQLEIINTSDQAQTINFDRLPPHLELKAIPETLKPGEKGVVEGTYDASKIGDWGFVVDRVDVLYNGERKPNNRLTISATITEDFEGMSAEARARAPKIEFQEKVFDFGTMKQRSTVEHEFIFTNTGQSDLLIRKVSSSCGCTAVSPKEKTIKPGESSSIKAIFSSGTRVGRQNKSITIITNAPDSPTVILRVSGNVAAPDAN